MIAMGDDDPRIIPAYAGSTTDHHADAADDGDHPRIRGEHFCCDSVPLSFHGSSPHTRGALHAERSFVRIIGIIPAYAGSTVCSVTPISRPRDHPRIRGEHLANGARMFYLPGSSPHTRGARRRPRTPALGEGIIPAYAGSTFMIRGR
mgnify:CR=1 FL=1